MFAKLVAVILGLGIVGGGLLALRQQRLEAASELARVQVQIRDQDDRLWRLRTQIAQHTRPEHVREMAVALGPLRPLTPVARSAVTRHAVSDGPTPEPIVVDAAPLPRSLRAPRAGAHHRPDRPGNGRYAIVEGGR